MGTFSIRIHIHLDCHRLEIIIVHWGEMPIRHYMTTTNYRTLGSLSTLLSCHILDAPTFCGAVGPTERTGTRVDVRFEMMRLREVPA